MLSVFCLMSKLGGKRNGEHGLVGAAESKVVVGVVSGQCRGDAQHVTCSTACTASMVGWSQPVLNRSCDALAMRLLGAVVRRRSSTDQSTLPCRERSRIPQANSDRCIFLGGVKENEGLKKAWMVENVQYACIISEEERSPFESNGRFWDIEASADFWR